MKELKKERNSTLDIIRIIALLSVISVHFFSYIGYYQEKMLGKQMIVLTILRTFFMICVPLFIVLTGYLMNNKKLNKGYYKGIIKTLGIYILASIACLLFSRYYLHNEFGVKYYISSILNFTGAPYAWYIEMYIGLFLLIPFLNLIYNNLQNKKEKQILLITMISLTSLPLIINIFRVTDISWWKMPSSNGAYNKLIPSCWTSIYPLTYYFIGCYLKEYKFKIEPLLNILLIIMFAIASGIFNYYRSYNVPFIWGPWQDWGSIINIIQTVLVFNLLLNIKVNDKHKKTKSFLKNVSDLCLGGYLVSWIFDQLFYPILNNNVIGAVERFKYYIIIVPIIFICSIALSYILNLIYKCLFSIFKRKE